MRRSLSRVLLPSVVAALLAVPAALSAQVHFLLAGGLSAPSGNFSNVVNSGYHGLVGLQFGVPLSPFSVRVTGEIDRFPARANLLPLGGSSSGHSTIADGSASAVFSFGGVGIVSPYVLAGLGVYRTSFSGTLGSGTSTDMGYHAGVGLNVGVLGIGLFAEARFVDIASSGSAIHYFPVSVGLRF